ncbi:unnamed protein product, partial [Ectocarpus fasciculatus]
MINSLVLPRLSRLTRCTFSTTTTAGTLYLATAPGQHVGASTRPGSNRRVFLSRAAVVRWQHHRTTTRPEWIIAPLHFPVASPPSRRRLRRGLLSRRSFRLQVSTRIHPNTRQRESDVNREKQQEVGSFRQPGVLESKARQSCSAGDELEYSPRGTTIKSRDRTLATYVGGLKKENERGGINAMNAPRSPTNVPQRKKNNQPISTVN